MEILSNGGTRTAPAARVHVHMATFLDWIHRGEQATSGKYYDFVCAVKDAEAQALLMATRTIRLAIVGGWHKVPMRDKDGNYVFKRDPMTGEILRDAQGRPEAELSDEYKEPDDARAAWYLERRAREDFGNHDPAVTVNVNPPTTRREPGKKETLDLFAQAVQILVDNGMELPKPVVLEHQGQKAIETTATSVDTPALNRTAVGSMSDKDLDDWVSSHVPQAGQAEKYNTIRAAGNAFVQVVCDCTPPSDEQTAAVHKIREAVYIANAAIAGPGE